MERSQHMLVVEVGAGMKEVRGRSEIVTAQRADNHLDRDKDAGEMMVGSSWAGRHNDELGEARY